MRVIAKQFLFVSYHLHPVRGGLYLFGIRRVRTEKVRSGRYEIEKPTRPVDGNDGEETSDFVVTRYVVRVHGTCA